MLKAKVQASQKSVNRNGKPKVMKHIKYALVVALIKCVHFIVSKIITFYKKKYERKMSRARYRY